MKKRNIGICIITTTLLMGGPAKATELILAKDHTNVVNQAVEIAAYKSNRPPVNKRLFTSKAVEAEITRVKSYLLIKNWHGCSRIVFQILLRQQFITVQQTVSLILSSTQEISMPCGYATPEHRFGLIYN